MDTDYAPAITPDDDEELKRQGYPLGDQDYTPVFPVNPQYAPNSPGAALSAASPSPAPLKVASNPPTATDYPAPEPKTPTLDMNSLAVTPAMPTLGSSAPNMGTDDLESRLASPRESVQDSERGAVHPPHWKNNGPDDPGYAPPEAHGIGKFGRTLNAMFLGGPQRDLAQRETAYKNAVSEYEAPITEQFKQAETEKNIAQAQKDRADAAGAGKNPDQQAFNELRSQINPGTGKPFTAVEARGKLEAQKSENTPKAVPATPADIQTLSGRITGSPYLTAQQKTEAGFPEGYTPTKDELKNRIDAVHDMETNARQGKQDEFNDNLRKIAAQNSELMAQAHLADEAEKRKQADAKDVMTADSGYAGLYAQENYKDKAQAWHKSANFAKDSGIVDSIVNQVHGEGGLPSIGGGATIGALIGGAPGALVGGAAPAVASLIMPMAQGYLDAAKRQGISKEGYAAMQAYFNALPARMSYEMQIQGLSAGVMRSSTLINKVLQTVPPPNTPGDQFNSAFDQYYSPMKTLTEKKVKLIAPKDYQPPAKETFYPKEAEGGNTPRTAKIGGEDVQIKDDGTFEHGGHTYKVNAKGDGGTLVK